MFKCFCFILKVWIIASIYNSEHQAALRDHDHHLLLRTCDNQKYYSSFYNLHPMQNTSMQCNATKASRGRLRNSNWHLQWFPDGEAGTIKTHFDGSCQLGPDTDSAWQAETGNWCGETGAAILGSVMRHLTGFNIFSWVACISVRWCRSWFWLFWWNWSQNENLFWVLNV